MKLGLKICLIHAFLIGTLRCENLVEIINNEDLGTLAEYLRAADLVTNLSSSEQNFTIFAPTNEAFEKIRELIPEDEEELKNILLYHVVNDLIMSENINNDLLVETINGDMIRTNVYLKSPFYPGFITINGARVSKSDIMASNGVVHVITDILMPVKNNIIETLMKDEESRFSTLLGALESADLIETLEGEGPFTLFAPTNEAFEKIPEENLQELLQNDEGQLIQILLRHVVPGTRYRKGISWEIHDTAGGAQIQTQVFKKGVMKVVSLEGGARLEQADISATNGVIHVIDSVI